jgi:hypothetical protein
VPEADRPQVNAFWEPGFDLSARDYHFHKPIATTWYAFGWLLCGLLESW